MKLTHLGISHFRSIGPEPVMIDLTKKITILVGQNDCGKSNVLRGVESVCRLLGSNPRLTDLDYHKREHLNHPKIHIQANQLRVHDEDLPIQNATLVSKLSAEFDAATWLEVADIEVPTVGALLDIFQKRWPVDQKPKSDVEYFSVPSQQQGDLLIPKTVLNDLACQLMYWLCKDYCPTFHSISQHRRIGEGDQYTLEGQGIIKLLSHWQHPEIGQDQLRKKFDRVEKLLRDLLDRPNVILEISHTHDKILVHDTKSGLRLPLESHGTGIHQLIILAIAVLSEDDALYGIEEPEIHLHPVLQKRFLKFLRKETTGHYIITTHSPVLIALKEDVDVIHLKMVDGVTIPRRIETDAGTLVALDDLGIRPSDLLQANSVIWVEGPSDRAYIKRWLELLAPDLTEGIDYSIMFYGGRLLSHLSMDREVDALVKLLRINQRSAVVMDSDRKKSGDELNDTKKRIIAECETSGVHSWVTHGREIENYLTQRVVEAVIAGEKQPLQDRFKLTAWGSFGDHFAKMVGNKVTSRFDYDSHKPAWAHRFAAEMTEADLSKELREEVGRLADFIRRRRPES